jgi:type II secretory pathway component GspD/PulD (secretin)
MAEPQPGATRINRGWSALTGAAAIITAAGAAATLLGQQQPPPDQGQRPQEQQQVPQPVQPGQPQPGARGNPVAKPVPGQPQPFNPAAQTPDQAAAADALRRRNEQIRRDKERLQQQLRDGGMPVGAVDAANLREQPVIGAPGDPALAPPPPPEGAVNHLAGEGNVKIDFGSEAVELSAFIDYVSLVLNVNILPDEAIAAQRVLFRAPLEIPKDQLLPLLSAIVEDKGFALIHDPLLGYFIKQAANVPLTFEGDQFSTTRIIRTPMVRPSSLQQTITGSLGTAGGNLRMSAFDELGILVATGTPRTVSAAEEFVSRMLDEVAGQGLHRYVLTNVEANYARSRVLTLNGRLGGGGGAIGGVPGGSPQAPVAGGLSNLENRIIVDAGNSLVFRGSEEEAAHVSELITLVDNVSPLISRRYSAGSVAGDIAAAGEREGLGPVGQLQGGTGGFGGLGGGFTGGQRSGQQNQFGLGGQTEAQTNTSGFSVDSETGTIIYYGTEAQHARVADLVKTFTDQIQGKRIEIKMYKLQNAEAESVADILTQLVQEQGSGRTGTSPLVPSSRVQGNRQQRLQRNQSAAEQGTGAQLTPDGQPVGSEVAAGEETAGGTSLTANPEEVSIVADTDRNQIVIKAPARQQAEFERIIKDLDLRLPQVYIEAQIVSVTTSEDFSWTVETQINAGQFLLFSSFGLSTAGTAAGGQQAAQAVRNVVTGRPGLTSAIIKSDYVPFILNTLQSQTEARIQSTPRILVNDNQQGSISSNREEPFSTTTQGTATTTTGQGGVATAGTTLDVTPRISGGGYISLEYSIELSSFVGNPSAGLQPPRQTENYDSTVTVPSDSTIVVGGFTLASESETDRGIPFLKDIPILGAAFKDYGSSKRRTTIFVFITPTIMNDPNFIDLRLATEGPMRRMNVEADTPPLEPVRIPITEANVLSSRRIPQNKAPENVSPDE